MVRAVNNLPRGADGLTVGNGEATLLSSETAGIVDGPGSDIGGDSSSGDEDNMGETIGIDGKLLDLAEIKESGDLLASSDRERLLGFADDSELEEEGSGVVIASSTIGLKMGGIGSGDSERSIGIEGETETLDKVDMVLLKLPFREC